MVALAIFTALVMSHGAVYFLGSTKGAAKVQLKWDTDTRSREQAVNNLRLDFASKETLHKTESKRIQDALTSIKEEHKESIASLQLEYTNRLRTSETRNSIYQRQAEGGTLERNRLAKFTAELDRTVEEGRGLVRELGKTLGQCEQQRQLFSEQIINDRRLY